MVFIFSIVLEEKERGTYYVASFFWFMITIYLINFLVPTKLRAFEVNKYEHCVLEDHFASLGILPNSSEEISLILRVGVSSFLSSSDITFYKEKVDFHEANAKRTYKDAKDKCWYLPDVDKREKAKQCFVIATSAILPSEPKSKLIGLLVATMVTYGLDCYDEWNFIKTKLHWSKYHYEMMEFYQSVLDEG